MRKADPKVVGKMICPECSGVMEVRERANGRKLLYTCCPSCGTDQRTGAAVQDFWRANMVAPNAEITVVQPKQTEPEPKKADSGTQTRPKNDSDDEWSPEQEFLPKGAEIGSQEVESKDQGNSPSMLGVVLSGLVTGICVGLGINAVRSGGGA